MPQVQYLDIPTWGQALGEFGGGFLDQFMAERKAKKERDDIAAIINQLPEDASEEDVIKAVFGSGKLSPERAQSVTGVIGGAKQRAQEKRSEKRKNELVAKYKSGKGLTEEEMAELDTATQISLTRPSSKGITTEPIPKETAGHINRVLSENPDANAEELGIKFAEAGVPPALSNQYVESRRRLQETQVKEEGKNKREIHKESTKWYDSLVAGSEAAKSRERAIDRQKDRIGKITDWDRYATAIFGNTPLGNLLKSQSAQEFEAAQLPFVEGMREIFGGRITDADLRFISQKIATTEKTPEANQAILDWHKLEGDYVQEKLKVAQEIIKENGGFRPSDFAAQVISRTNERMGDKIDEAMEKIKSLEDDQTKKLDLTGRVTVPPGTPLNDKVIDYYLQITNNDPDAAERMAREDGYDF